MTDVEDADDDLYFDAVPLNSRPASILSRLTLFHSAVDISTFEEKTAMMPEVEFSGVEIKENGNSDDKSQMNDDDPDFILVWSKAHLSTTSLRRKNSKAETFESTARSRRDIFEQHLKDQGLVLEYETIGTLEFVKIFTPKEVLRRYCEILKLRMPMKEFPDQEEPKQFTVITEVTSFLSKLLQFMYIDSDKFPPEKFKLTAEYSRNKHYLFDEDAPNFFSAPIRSIIVDFILSRQNFSEDPDDMNCVGIQRLLDEGVYKAAYPLHDGDYNAPGSMRYLLYTEWATIKNWVKNQPIDHIKEYFGVKVALYFAWLGFYTHMLIPASIAGITVFCFGLFTLSRNTVSEDICNRSRDITMCPLCDKNCDYWKLSDTCLYAKFTYLFDNPLTVFFAFFMSVWATVFLELWKRYSASVTHRWGLTGFTVQAEHPRPEYLAKLATSKKQKINVVTGAVEPSVPFWKVKVPATLLSFSVALLLLLIALGAVFGVVLYRMCVLTSISLFSDAEWLSFYSNLVIPTTAAILNLICITLLNYVYEKMAVYLTELEYLRTQTEFDESLTLKIYLFQFINYYSSIVYMAFLKGKFTGYPAKYNRIFGLRQEECSPAGCLMELCIQLAIIMIGNQAMNSVLEMIIPPIMSWYSAMSEVSGLSSVKSTSSTSATEAEDDTTLVPTDKSWYKDYKLLDWGPRGLFVEYLEMVMQYGFVTIFVSAFPLAPLFALLNNIFEMRLDAQKFLRFYRRPVPHRAPNIGVWFRILDVLGKISVVSNAFIIAFSSNFIPRMVYKYVVNQNRTEEGFLNHSLAYFNTSDFPVDSKPLYPSENVTLCRYQQYRDPPWAEKRYKRPIIYWQVLVARLMFIVIFQNVVSLVTIAVQWLIPDMSARLRDQIKREAYLTSELIIRHEAQNKAAWTSEHMRQCEGLKRNGSDRGVRKRSSLTAESKL
ncbi:unnamed protein product [Bemisia tabaci]|uniref:Anoctamin n=1 Tax=Bemisia tabaci TaxID=7038 RepID=A0A9P0A6S2_BEMTA|nr:unnamed protein product [Bemisia tabaci]